MENQKVREEISDVPILNPLKNPLILSKLFECLPVKDRKSFRLVNRLWRDVCLEKWRKSTLFVIGKNDLRMNAFLELCAGGKNEAYRIREFPFRRICIYETDVTCADLTEEMKSIISKSSEINKKRIFPMEFWDIAAPQIHHLELIECSLYSSSTLSGIGWILLEKCLELEKFALRETSFWNEYYANLEPEVKYPYEEQFFTSVFYENFDGEWVKRVENEFPSVERNESRAVGKGCAEKLTTFSFDNTAFDILDYTRVDFWQIIFEMIPNIQNICADGVTIQPLLKALGNPTRNRKKRIELKGLGVNIFNKYGVTDPTKIEIFDSVKLMEYMKFGKAIPHVEMRIFKGLAELRNPPFPFHQLFGLSKWTNSLTKLIIHVGNTDGAEWFTDLTGRSFPLLKHLALLFHETCKSNFKIDFGMLCGMPLLRKLVCYSLIKEVAGMEENLSENELKYEGRDEWIGISNVEDFSTLELNHLEEFQFRVRKNLGNKALRRLGEVMKNLKRLAIVVNPENFAVIPEIWPNLQKLTFLPNFQHPLNPREVSYAHSELFGNGFVGHISLAMAEAQVNLKLGAWESNLGAECHIIQEDESD